MARALLLTPAMRGEPLGLGVAAALALLAACGAPPPDSPTGPDAAMSGDASMDSPTGDGSLSGLVNVSVARFQP